MHFYNILTVGQLETVPNVIKMLRYSLRTVNEYRYSIHNTSYYTIYLHVRKLFLGV